jgi:adenylate cyclase
MGEPRVPADGLRSAYWEDLIARRDESVRKLKLQQALTASGTTIPEDEHLVIGEGRHIAAAVMLIDISGFSGWPSANQVEQADVLTVLNLFMSEMIRILRDYGGEVEKNTGDGLLAYFDAQPGEDESETCKRALGCALTMHACTAFLINPVLLGSLPKVRFRVGLDYGQLTIARIGSPRVFSSRVAIGSTANVAAKMLAHGSADDIIIGNNLRAQLPTAWSQHAEFLTADSGFFYKLSGAAYSLYRYTGRWTRLV